MNKKKWIATIIVLTFLIPSFFIIPSLIPAEAFSKRIVTVGQSGGDVSELQGRLKHLGFYTGPVDGTFNWRTYWALRNFQYEFGLRTDGVLGPRSKVALWNATKNWRPDAGINGTGTAANGTNGSAKGSSAANSTANNSDRTASLPRSNHGLSENEINMMANAVYGEARGEPFIGQVAVAAVILNRTHSPSFPKSPTSVIFEPGAFTAVSDGQIYLKPNARAKKAVLDALNGWDPTGGALYYFNPDTATSGWIWSRPQIKKIGKHIFCK
ncbi:spore cortex-lytic enzyme [Aneurinibacillus terranovensis]|uniref:spore cortex-lytic enzyme n=1 Tax=Aneurinibacillus terranovensis TaxID=278991 RepID=UPI0004090F9C|nr:spore cortex-lytic enzyme [Aneurinibacillus terranovensis]